MEKLKKVSRAQWCFFALLIGFAFLMQNCQDDDAVIYDESQTETELNARPVKVTVCRQNLRKGTYSVVTVVDKRVLPGDVVIDADGDGYEAPNECNLFSGLDCNDSNVAINPGAVEICSDGIDNDCDGVIDDGCTTYVPDDNFEAYLEANDMGNGTANDDYVLTANINTVTYLSLPYENISNLTGIAGFAALQELHCWNNNLTSLDLSQNTELIEVVCADNALTNIDVSNSANLDHLDCNGNQLTSLNLSANSLLTYLACTGNLLTTLDMSANTALRNLQCNLNSIENLNISGCPLQELYCDNNQLTSLDITNNAALLVLSCSNNNLSSINVNHLTALNEFNCNDNQLTSLDVSANEFLNRLYSYHNPFTCIKVNDAQLASAPANINWWKDWDTIYSLDCPS